jgi:hypothetical protein
LYWPGVGDSASYSFAALAMKALNYRALADGLFTALGVELAAKAKSFESRAG